MLSGFDLSTNVDGCTNRIFGREFSSYFFAFEYFNYVLNNISMSDLYNISESLEEGFFMAFFICDILFVDSLKFINKLHICKCL